MSSVSQGRHWVLAVVEQTANGPNLDLPNVPHLYVTNSIVRFATNILDSDIMTFESANEAFEESKEIQLMLHLFHNKKYDTVSISRIAHPIRGLMYCAKEFSKIPTETLMHPAISLGLAQILQFTEVFKEKEKQRQKQEPNATPEAKPKTRPEYVFTKYAQDYSKPPVFLARDGEFVEDPYDPNVVMWDSLELAEKYLSGIVSMSPELVDRTPIDRTRNIVLELAEAVSYLVYVRKDQQINPLLLNALIEVNRFINTDHIQANITSASS